MPTSNSPKILSIIFALLLSCFCMAQERMNNYGIQIGLNTGAVLGPIEENASGSIIPGPSLGFFYHKSIHPKWTLAPSINYFFSGLKFNSFQPKSDTTWTETFDGQSFDIPVTYTADVEGKMRFHLLQLSLPIIWQINNRWETRFGPRLAALLDGYLGGVADVTIGDEYVYSQEEEDFDDTPSLRHWDAGLMMGAGRKVFKYFNLNVDIHTGFLAVSSGGEYIKDAYYHFFVNTSLAYRFRRDL